MYNNRQLGNLHREEPIALHIERPPTLTHTVTNAIRESIFRGAISPGEPLREVTLAESLDVSRITVHEALRELREEGVVEVFPHRGAFVTQLSAKRAREVYSFRALVEPYAVRLALEAGAYSRDDLERMKMLAQRLGELEESSGDLYELAKTDIEFHHLACSRSNHSLLMETFERLQSITWLFVLHTRIYDVAAYSREPSHLDVFEAIQTADPDVAGNVVRQHIEGVGKVLVSHMGERARG